VAGIGVWWLFCVRFYITELRLFARCVPPAKTGSEGKSIIIASALPDAAVRSLPRFRQARQRVAYAAAFARELTDCALPLIGEQNRAGVHIVGQPNSKQYMSIPKPRRTHEKSERGVR